MSYDILKNLIPVQTSPMSSQMTPEQLAELEARRKKNPTTVMSGVPTAPAQPQMGLGLHSLSVANMIDPEQRALESDLRNKFKQLVVDQEAGIENQREGLNAIKAMPQKLDLRGLAAYADFMNDGKTKLYNAASDMAPMDEMERAKMIQALEGQLQDDRNALTGTLADQLRTGMATKMQMRALDQQDKNTRFQMSQNRSLFTKFNSDVRNDIKPVYELLPAYGAVEAALTPDANGRVNAQRVKMALSNAARLMGEKGVLTDQDIGRVQMQTLDQLAAQAENFVRGPEGTIPAEYVNQLRAAITDGKAAWGGAAQRKLRATRDTYVAGGLDPNLASEVVDSIYGQGFLQPLSAAPAAAPKSTIADILAQRNK